MVAQQGVPEDVARRLKATADKMLMDDGFRALLEKQGYIVKRPHDAPSIAKFTSEDSARWAAVIKAQNISLD